MDRKGKRKQRRRIRRAVKRYREAEDKAARCIRDFHYKAAHYLLQRFKTIVLPTTSAHKWRQKRGKRAALCARTKRSSMMLRFGLFAKRLVQVATDYDQSCIVRSSEAYTSIQCGACGYIHDGLGGSKVFKCPACQMTADRDVHAARNILLRCLPDPYMEG